MGAGEGREENGLASFTQGHARHGTNPANQHGSLPSCSPSKSSRCSRTLPHLRFDHESVSRVGMQAESGKATARIRDTGKRWHNSWGLQGKLEALGKNRASGAAEFHHRALSEPDVSLSAHPAPGIRLLA